MPKKASKSRGKIYFVKVYEGIIIVKEDFFNEVLNRTEALSLATEAHLEILRVLADDALTGRDSYIGNMKIVSGLSRTLAALECKFPCVLDELAGMPLKVDGCRIFKD